MTPEQMNMTQLAIRMHNGEVDGKRWTKTELSQHFGTTCFTRWAQELGLQFRSHRETLCDPETVRRRMVTRAKVQERKGKPRGPLEQKLCKTLQHLGPTRRKAVGPYSVSVAVGRLAIDVRRGGIDHIDERVVECRNAGFRYVLILAGEDLNWAMIAKAVEWCLADNKECRFISEDGVVT